MLARLLFAGLTAMLVLGCAAQPELHGAAQSSTTGTTLVRSGFVTDVRDVGIHDHSSSPAAPAIGAVVGGVAGSLFGSGSGRALAAIGGAAGGSIAAQQLAKPGTSYLRKVSVRFEDGQTQTYDVGADETFQVGQAVKIINRNGNIQLER
jgi:outer membrane lipoprotein SlyB